MASFALIALVGLIAYSNSFTGEFIYDDKDYIAQNPVIGDLRSMLNPPDGIHLSPNLRNTLSPRIVTMISFWVNYRLGGINPAGYHIVNFLIHLTNAILVYLLALVTLRPKGNEPPSYAPLFAALLFVSHPLMTLAVTYITQRFTSMAALFYLASLLAYITARRSGWNRRGYALYALCLISAVLAMKSKEIAFTLPLSAALYDYLFLTGERKARFTALVPLFLIASLVPLGHMNTGVSLQTAIESGSRATTEYSRTEYLLTQPRVLVTYVRLFFFPAGQNLLYDYTASRSLFELKVLLPSLFLLAVLGTGLWLALRGKGLSTRVAGFGILWFFITISIESSVFPLSDLISEHRTYLPVAGLCIGFAAGIAGLAQRIPISRRTLFAAALVIITALAGMTYARNPVYRDSITLWRSVTKKFPDLEKGRASLIETYFDLQRYEDIERNLSEDAENNSAVKRHLQSRLHQEGLDLYNSGAYDNAIRKLEFALRLSAPNPAGQPGDAAIHTDLGNAYMAKGMVLNAVTHYEEALRLAPDDPSANNNLANAYETMGNTGKAIYYYQAALSRNPNVPDVHFNLAMLYAGMGKKNEARLELESALRLAPDDAQAREELDKLGRPPK